MINEGNTANLMPTHIIDITNDDGPPIEALALSEEEQLMMAIQNSLRETYAGNQSDDSLVIDSDHETDVKPMMVDDDYTKYLGSNEGICLQHTVFQSHINVYFVFFCFKDPLTKIVLRLPCGEKKVLEWPCSSQLKALTIYITRTYPDITKQPYKVILSYPRKNLLEMDDTTTLKEAQLHPTAILHLHQDD